MFVEGGPEINDNNKVEDDKDNISSITELNGADEHGIEVSYEVCKDRMRTILKFQPMMIETEKITMTMAEMVMMTMSIAVWR